ncbi:MAG: cation:proton antiporter [Actinomycetota bacterium]
MEEHAPELIATIAIALPAAFVGGFVARHLRLPAIVGYLLAGVAIGPATPGLVANTDIALELAEIGVILLMFGVGLHFSVQDLLRVRSVALPGAVGQITVAIGLGMAVGLAIGGDPLESFVLGLAISVASTVVLLRALERRNAVNTPPGQVAVGWLIVEDLFTVIALVLLPTVATAFGAEGQPGSEGSALVSVAAAIGKAIVFTALMLVVGARVLPWILDHVERDGFREIFTLAVLSIALGIAFVASVVFDVSLALGAFLAGAVLNESHLTERAAKDILPLSDTFGVLFFVAVGMLLDPAILLDSPAAIAALVGVVVIGKSLAALLIVLLLRRPLSIGLTVAAGLAQIGEFSFIVATAGTQLGMLSDEGFQLVVATAVLSVSINPLLFAAIEPVERWVRRRPSLARTLEPGSADVT